ncbi:MULTISPECIES: hypothetical protein [Bradyrhizobium]|uniref:hypothetical protein n=1 Tax=Bradyrhizobium TaxID=374 RepID=UPI00055931BF|nr:hypothetical protein [Bradyrhizobium japonicum]WLB89385.1 hypothetical protein QIH91_01725 [Bradyrhizobium japonicum USDA 135]
MSAQTIYPIDRAEILAGAKFDFKVELPGPVDPAKLKVTVNGADYATAFGRAGTFIEREDGKDQSALERDVFDWNRGSQSGRFLIQAPCWSAEASMDDAPLFGRHP